MHWEDDSKRQNEFIVPDDVVDVSFKLSCRQLPTTHAYELAQALYRAVGFRLTNTIHTWIKPLT